MIKTNELTKVFDYDKTLGTQIDGLNQLIEEIYSLVESESWNDTPPKIRNTKIMLLDIEKKWDSREQQFRPMEV